MTTEFEALFQHAPCGLVRTVDGVITEANDTILQWLGRSRDEVVGTTLTQHLDSGSRLYFETRHAPVLLLAGTVRDASLTLVRADGTPVSVLLNSTVHDGAVHTAVFDAGARADYERELIEARRTAQNSEARVRVLQASSSAFVSSSTEEQVCVALFAAATEAFSATATGVFLLDDEGEYHLVAGEHPLDGALPRSAPRASDAALLEERTMTISVRDTGSPYTALIAGLRERRLDSVTVIPLLRNGLSIGVLACFFARERSFDAEYTELQAALSRQAALAISRVRLQKELERLALHDQLTGLDNRNLILENVNSAITRARLTGRPLAVVFLDLDGFKRVNDELGHSTGDSVLRQVAVRLRDGVRQSDSVGRYGGDEFVAICEDADEDAAAGIAHRIREAVAQHLEGVPAHYTVTASVGVAIFSPSDDVEPANDELIGLADKAMYAAKSTGKDRVSFLHH